jgi:hypothetical protein
MTAALATLVDDIEMHLSAPGISALVPAMRQSYLTDDYAEIDQFMPDHVFDLALRELTAVFARDAHRRDLIIRQSGNTPRRYSNVDRDSLSASCTVVPEVFRSPALYRLLTEIVGEKVLPIPYLPEEYIASRLHRAGDVHGWHWDDYTWALVWIFQMPPEANGGSLEYIRRAPWNRQDPQVERLVQAGPVTRRHPGVGSAYLLKADTALHRVSPLTRDDERLIVCYSFASEADLTREVDHDSMAALYPQSHGKHYG